MITPVIKNIINRAGALTFQHPNNYPKKYEGRVPLKIRMLKTVTSDIPFFFTEAKMRAPDAIEGQEYYVHVNSHGAVTVIFENGTTLGVRPKEFEVIEWHKQSETEI